MYRETPLVMNSLFLSKCYFSRELQFHYKSDIFLLLREIAWWEGGGGGGKGGKSMGRENHCIMA